MRVALDALGELVRAFCQSVEIQVSADAVRLVPRSTATIIAKKVIERQTPVELGGSAARFQNRTGFAYTKLSLILPPAARCSLYQDDRQSLALLLYQKNNGGSLQ